MREAIDEIKETLSTECKKLKNVRAIFIYGSFARGDNDENSDMDILVIAESDNNKIENIIRDIITRFLDKANLDISVYSGNRFETLLEYGSLFLHHIRQEGILVYGKGKYSNKEYLFGKLTSFKGISEDLLLYSRMHEKIEKSISENGINYYDLNILCILARNTMIVTCYHLGIPKFGKWDVYEICASEESFEGLSRQTYADLLQFRSYYNRMKPLKKLPKDEVCKNYCQEVDKLINWALKMMGVNNTLDRMYFLFCDNAGRNFYTSYEIFVDFERDIYIGIREYMNKKYEVTIDSIADPFIAKLIDDYPDECLVDCAHQLLNEIKRIKRSSSNYSIDTPDVYSEIHIKQNSMFEQFFDLGERYLFFRKILNKIKDVLKIRGSKNEKDVLVLLDEFRKYINLL